MHAYYTTREASQLLEVSLRTVQIWVDRGILEAWKTTGGHRRITSTSVTRMANIGMPFSVLNGDGEEPFKVLVLADNYAHLKQYRLRLSAWNFPLKVTTLSNAYDALLEIGNDSPDLMILNCRLPRIDIMQMIHHLSQSNYCAGMKIVVVTDATPAELGTEGELPSSVEIFTQPLSFDKLRSLVQLLLLRRRIHEPAGSDCSNHDTLPGIGCGYSCECADGRLARSDRDNDLQRRFQRSTATIAVNT